MKILKLSDYQIVIGDFWVNFSDFLSKKKYSKIIVLVDANTEGSCFERFRTQFPKEIAAVIRVPSGEINKTIDTCQQIWRALFKAEADRNSVLICIGGGVIGDMGGFAASTFKRGIDFIQMPTTLLSQVDSSIGGKLGIDFQEVKNSIGVFANPKAVFISPQFLDTLSQREIRSGFGEIIKHTLIADAKQWQKLRKLKNLAKVDWTKIITPSLKIKKHVVKIDPFEKDLRKALNFGHTIGHAIESMALATKNPLTHGEAIAIGMVCEAYLSKILRGLSEKELEEICTFIFQIYGIYDIKQFDYQQLIALMRQDKKNEAASKINFSLLPQIGSVEVNCIASESEIEAALRFYIQLCSQ
jgi:3-dehydroquinate synthase